MATNKQTRAQPLTCDALERFVAKARRAQDVADHLCAYGPGLTFGELAIGEQFEWAPPLTPDPRDDDDFTYRAAVGELPLPYVKVAADRYELHHKGRVVGTGAAEEYYRVERHHEGQV